MKDVDKLTAFLLALVGFAILVYSQHEGVSKFGTTGPLDWPDLIDRRLVPDLLVAIIIYFVTLRQTLR